MEQLDVENINLMIKFAGLVIVYLFSRYTYMLIVPKELGGE